MDSKAYIRYRCELNGRDYSAFKSNEKKCDKAFQKVIKNSKGEKKYFINYFLYEPTRSTPDNLYGITAEAHLFRNNQKDWFIVSYQANSEGRITDIEDFFEDMYEKMGCHIDPHNNY
jgi:hypothetical protein